MQVDVVIAITVVGIVVAFMMKLFLILRGIMEVKHGLAG